MGVEVGRCGIFIVFEVFCDGFDYNVFIVLKLFWWNCVVLLLFMYMCIRKWVFINCSVILSFLIFLVWREIVLWSCVCVFFLVFGLKLMCLFDKKFLMIRWWCIIVGLSEIVLCLCSKGFFVIVNLRISCEVLSCWGIGIVIVKDWEFFWCCDEYVLLMMFFWYWWCVVGFGNLNFYLFYSVSLLVLNCFFVLWSIIY